MCGDEGGHVQYNLDSDSLMSKLWAADQCADDDKTLSSVYRDPQLLLPGRDIAEI